MECSRKIEVLIKSNDAGGLWQTARTHTHAHTHTRTHPHTQPHPPPTPTHTRLITRHTPAQLQSDAAFTRSVVLCQVGWKTACVCVLLHVVPHGTNRRSSAPRCVV